MDFAAATPLLPEAKAAMEPFLVTHFANPSSIHQEGVVARQAIDEARSRVARSLQVRPEFVTFTGSGTEANNLAIFGVIESLKRAGRKYAEMEVITTKIEHPSIARAMDRLADLGVEVKYVSVNDEGVVVVQQLKKIVTTQTVLVSISYVNSEIGVIQPVRQIQKALNDFEQQHGSKIILHIDAAQAPLWLSCQFDAIAADLLMLDAGKCCGPKGVGVLVRSKRVDLQAVSYGGGQEQGLRSGTENVPGIVGAAVAVEEAQAGWRERADRVTKVRDQAIEYILKTVPDVILNGPTADKRLANNINISIPGLDTEYAVVVLDSKGFAVSTKSACSGAGGGESVVVREISGDSARASATLRITLGPETKFESLKNMIDILAEHTQRMKGLTQ